jgi:hypothetical protein
MSFPRRPNIPSAAAYYGQTRSKDSPAQSKPTAPATVSYGNFSKGLDDLMGLAAKKSSSAAAPRETTRAVVPVTLKSLTEGIRNTYGTKPEAPAAAPSSNLTTSAPSSAPGGVPPPPSKRVATADDMAKHLIPFLGPGVRCVCI